MNLEDKAKELRHTVLAMCERAKTGHVTSSFSCVEILIALYYKVMRLPEIFAPPGRPGLDMGSGEYDRFILSKGQASPILYAILADLGYFPEEWLEKWCQKDGFAGVHLQMDVPGAEITAGSLGHGFGIACGMALSFKKDMKNNMVFTLLGDGECYEGSVWETAMFAGHNRLNNLVAIVDRNSCCATNMTEDALSLEPLKEKWRTFGWSIIEVDGHSIRELIRALDAVRHRRKPEPVCIIAYTVKGYPIDFISDDWHWHARCLLESDYERAKEILG